MSRVANMAMTCGPIRPVLVACLVPGDAHQHIRRNSAWFSQMRPITDALVILTPVFASIRSKTLLKVRLLEPASIPL